MPRFRRRRPRGVRRRRRRARPRRMSRRSRRVVLDPERKVNDVEVGTFAVSAIGSSFLLNGIAQGSGNNQRQGLQHIGLSQLVTYTLDINATTGSNQEVKVALVLFKQPAGTGLLIPNIWDNTGGPSAVIAHRNLQNALRFKILWTRTHRLDLANQTVNRVVMRRMRLKTRYLTAGGGVANQSTGALYLVVLSSTNTVADQPTCLAQCRYRFVG